MSWFKDCKSSVEARDWMLFPAGCGKHGEGAEGNGMTSKIEK